MYTKCCNHATLSSNHAVECYFGKKDIASTAQYDKWVCKKKEYATKRCFAFHFLL